MDNYEAIHANLLVQTLKREARLSERQIALLTWAQLYDGKLHTNMGREVKLTSTTWAALRALPVRGRYVFSTSPLPPFGVPLPSKTEALREHWQAHRHLRIKFD